MFFRAEPPRMKCGKALQSVSKIAISSVGDDHVKRMYLAMTSDVSLDALFEFNLAIAAKTIDQTVGFLAQSIGITQPLGSIRLASLGDSLCQHAVEFFLKVFSIPPVALLELVVLSLVMDGVAVL